MDEEVRGGCNWLAWRSYSKADHAASRRLPRGDIALFDVVVGERSRSVATHGHVLRAPSATDLHIARLDLIM
jgi:hypothetical protein